MTNTFTYRLTFCEFLWYFSSVDVLTIAHKPLVYEDVLGTWSDSHVLLRKFTP